MKKARRLGRLAFLGKVTVCHLRGTRMPEISFDQFTKDQRKGLKMLRRWESSGAKYASIRGFAGTGKTTLLSTLGRPFWSYTAPTNKAAGVLQQSLGEECRTVYSFLGLRMEEVEDQLELRIPKTVHIPPGTVLVTDESSMLPRNIVGLIKEAVHRFDMRVLIVGDPLQINPIGEPRSLSFSLAAPEWTTVLREPVRYDDDIAQACKIIRKAILGRSRFNIQTSEHVHRNTRRSFNAGIQKLKLEDFKETKVLAWRNRTVDSYNTMIRRGFGFEEDYCPEEPVVLLSPMKQGDSIIAHTDTEFTVMTARDTSTRVLQQEYGCREIMTKEGLAIRVPTDLRIAHDLRAIAASARKAKDKREAKETWAKFWMLKNWFNPVAYSYAMTLHRAQGSTMKSVCLDAFDIMHNQDKQEAMRLCYTGLSRASNTVEFIW